MFLLNRNTTTTKFPREYYAYTICPEGHDCVQFMYKHEGIIVHQYCNYKKEPVQVCCEKLQQATTKIIPNSMKSDKKKNVIYCKL